MPASERYRPATRHADLGPKLFDLVAPARFPEHILRHRNQRWAARVGLDTLTDTEWIAHFGQFQPLPGTFQQPLALRYHGHQFRSYNPELGDGRGFLFAQLHDLGDGRLLDLGTKGSGQTPWSRSGDGRLTLKGGLRELLATEMLEALGVNTSKTFSLIETGEALVRQDEPSPTRGSVLVRLNHSHVRIGTFQRLTNLRDDEALRRLLDHTVRTYAPEDWRADPGERAAAFLAGVCHRVAEMGAQWMLAGFVHGVLNTDNINITGESFDYGPWRFLPQYDPDFTAAYFDHSGLYAYGRQPGTLLWNLVRLAECLLPLSSKDALEAALAVFGPAYQAAFTGSTLRRLGLEPAGQEQDERLTQLLWEYMAEQKPPFEQVFFDLFGDPKGMRDLSGSPGFPSYESAAFAPVRTQLEGYSRAPWADPAHRYFSRPRPCTMLIDEVESLWAPIAEDDDWSAASAKLNSIAEMAEALGNHTAPP